jgi:hypothetical protein
MSPTQEYQRGRFAEALARWRAELAAGRSWDEVQAEIVACCEGRVDLLTGLLIEAETLRGSAEGTTRRASSPCTQRHDVPPARHHHWSGPRRMPEPAITVGHWY